MHLKTSYHQNLQNLEGPWKGFKITQSHQLGWNLAVSQALSNSCWVTSQISQWCTYYLNIQSCRFISGGKTSRRFLKVNKNPGMPCNIGYNSETILNSNLVKSRLAIISVSIFLSFWNFAQSMAVLLPCFVQNFKTIEYLINKLSSNEITRDLV